MKDLFKSANIINKRNNLNLRISNMGGKIYVTEGKNILPHIISGAYKCETAYGESKNTRILCEKLEAAHERYMDNKRREKEALEKIDLKNVMRNNFIKSIIGFVYSSLRIL